MTSFLFVDSRVQDIDVLLAGLDEDVQVVLLDAGTDGVKQMLLALRGATNLASIHIVSHGSSGTLYLGSTVLTQENLDDYQTELSRIGGSLSADGDILLYGCNVANGATGAQFLQQLSERTGADVAASTDPTGALATGGNWGLEASTGSIEAVTPFSAAARLAYIYTLADDYASTTSTTGTVSVGGSTSGNIETGGDTDWFKVTLVAGQTYQFDVKGADTGNGTLADPYMRLRDGAGNSLLVDDDSGTGLNARITYTPSSSGTYIVSAGSASLSATGTYLVSATVTSGLPDLDARNGDPDYPATLSASSVEQGTSVTLSYRVSNWGPGAAGSSTSGIYRSTDGTISTGDTLLTTDAVAALGALVGSPETVTFSTSGWAPGTYYIGAVADYNNAIAEGNETNNPSNGVMLTVTSGLPDLDARNVDGDGYQATLNASSVEQGTSVTLTYRVSNWGPGAAGSSTSGIYRSTDSTISTGDTLFTTDAVAALGAVAGITEQVTFSTSGWAPGTYYIGAIADYSNAIAETNETNNPSNAVALTVTSDLPDLDARNGDPDYAATLDASSVAQGASVTLTYRVSNWGPGAAGSSTSGIYRSSDATITTGDTLLTTDAVGALGALVGSWESATFSTSGWAPGTYYIGAVADYNNAIAETNETNNPSNGVALTVTSAQPTYSITPASTTLTEDNTSITFTVTRSGSFPAETLYVSTLLDTASAPGDYDGLVAQPLVVFAAGDTTKTFTVGINEDTAPEGATPEHFRVMIAKNQDDTSGQALDTSDVYIQDDDSVSTWSFDASNKSVLENQGSVTFTLTRSNPVGQETVYISTVQNWNGSGVYNQSDYTPKLSENLTFLDGQAQRTVTINITDDQVPENSETFGLIVQSSPNALVSSFLTSASFTITNDDPTQPPIGALQTAAQIFNEPGNNKLLFMANLANAAYGPSASFTKVDGELQMLNANDLGATAISLTNGMYVRDEAAALVGRSADALFIAFRGTDQGMDWVYNFGLMDAHYSLFAPLLSALNSYLRNDSTIHTVYVTGHSLGGAMTVAFMDDPSTLYPDLFGRPTEAVTFASPGYEDSFGAVRGTIVNLGVESDPVWNASFLPGRYAPGDTNVLHGDLHGDLSITELESHAMGLYLSYTELLQTSGIDVAQLRSFDGFDYDSFVADVLVAYDGTVFSAGAGPDTLNDTAGRDILLGGFGEDHLHAGRLVAGVGMMGDGTEDILYGGPANDTYHFYADSGNDTIFDSSGTNDVILLDAGVMPKSVTQHGSDVSILYGSGAAQITISDYDAHPVESLQWNGTTSSIDALLDSLDQQADLNAASATAQAPGSSFNASAIIGFAVDASLLTQTAQFLSSFNPFGNDALASIPSSGDLSAAAASDGIDGMTQAIVGFRDLIGTEMGDRLIGDTQGNILDGGGGADYIEGGDGNDVLIGAAGDDQVQGGGGDDIIVGGSGPGNDTYDGGDGIDTAVFSDNLSAYTIGTAGATVSGPEGNDTLSNIERLKFSDRSLAFDMTVSEAGGKTALLLGACLGADGLGDKVIVGAVLDYFDGDYTLTDAATVLVDAGIVAQLAGGADNQHFVDWMALNVVDALPDAATEATLISYITSGQYTQATFLATVAGHSLNQNHIGLVGLQDNGMEFV